MKRDRKERAGEEEREVLILEVDGRERGGFHCFVY